MKIYNIKIKLKNLMIVYMILSNKKITLKNLKNYNNSTVLLLINVNLSKVFKLMLFNYNPKILNFKLKLIN